ncbi:carboxypeptidase regulatory-like domain-containing protein [uncultured Pseudacidovorax sp.]|uniref:carboxypeptidase regulatory-like domain-containing protein n=1 Tax=uncultured Pseudacidovorax sp. TaxID=679313 RepID=UPI0025D394F8|nr:carboxypeptidase regulatory-like domain-containing protein [uncultured Pseudacidovorax sp.]
MKLAPLVLVCAVLSACGGGGGGGSGFALLPTDSSGSGAAATPAPAPAPAPSPAPAPAPAVAAQTVLSGVAATGAPLAGAAVTVTDAGGAVVCSGETQARGDYRCVLPAGTRAPLLVRVSRDDQVLYSAATTTAGTANVTPLTTVVVSRLAPDGNPASLATSTGPITAQALAQQVAQLNTALQPVLAALGVSAANPLTDTLVANGTGQDRLLDALGITIRPDGTGSNIEITVKGADSAVVPPLRFRSSDASVPATLPASIQLAEVPPPDVVAELMQRIAACYALPLTQRVGTATSDTGVAVGAASDVVAPGCRQIFLNDDPSTYYHSGQRVGRNANNQGAWAGLFRGGATGLKLTRGNVEYVRSDSDLVLSYRWEDTQGNSDFDTLRVRKVDGKLKVVGNGYDYAASVTPFAQHRDLLNTPAYSSFNTGYDISINNRVDGNGNPVFSKVEVGTPSGRTLTFVPQAGLSFLVITRSDGSPTATSVLRVRGEYTSSGTAGNPAEKETSIFFTNPQASEGEIANYGNQGRWTMKFFHVDTSKAPVEQSYRTLSRALTIGELRQLAMPTVTDAVRAELIAQTGATGYIQFGAPSRTQVDRNVVDFSAAGDKDGWVVPSGALAPTTINVYGSAPFGSSTSGQPGNRFNDSATVRSTQRKVVINCTTQTVGDRHCDATDPTQYANGSTVNSLQLYARNAQQVGVNKLIGLYKLQ